MRNKTIIFNDYMYFWNLRTALGTVYTSILLNYPSAGKALKEELKQSARRAIDTCKEDHLNKPQSATVDLKTIKACYKTYYKTSKNILKKGLPEFLKEEYNDMVVLINNLSENLYMEHKLKLKKLKFQ